MSFPNESPDYRKAREALLKEEQELVTKVKALAAKRRTLPRGGKLKEDYVFERASEGQVGQKVKFSDLFGQHDTLLLYSFMFGPNWDKPCMSCTSLMDGFDRAWYSVSRKRGWTQIPLLSGFDSSFQADYNSQAENDDMQLPVMHVFRKQDGGIYHFWSTESMSNHVDTVWAYWNLMDFTPEGRPNLDTPPANFVSQFLQKNYIDKE